MQTDLIAAPRRRGSSLIAAVLFVIAVAFALALVPVPSLVARAAETDPHADLLAETSYPTAAQCGSCHGQIFSEWASSNHAYASISPMFHKFEQAINDLSSGTIRGFCVRCHQQVGTQRGEERWLPLWERSAVAREGVTCITCHRISEQYAKTNGERSIVPGDIHTPVTGAGDGEKLGEVIAQKDSYRVSTGPTERGNKIHLGVFKLDQISKSEFCVSCHQVAVHPGIKLEVVWDQYRASPALAEGVSCQDCHMGKVPGVASGYETAPSAVVNGKPVNPGRKHSNHAFYGPGYPIAHPGIFPINPKAAKFDIRDWLKFDHRAGWGTQEFEDKVESGQIRADFPEPWTDRIDREEAREIVDENHERLEEKRELRRKVMENGSRLDGPFFAAPPRIGQKLAFTYRITNTNNGHNLPSGSLGAQPEIWLNVALIGPDGRTVWESGYVDSHGDMADLHSLDVLAGRIPRDTQLVNLQTKFLTQNVKGTDREMYLPINFDVDQLPFIRPASVPTTVLNHPPGIRMEARSIPPLGTRDATYEIPASLMTQPGKYRLAVRMRSRAEPIYFMKFVKATQEMEQSMNEWMLDIHPYSVAFDVR
jgi:hypothetical protein